MQNQSLQPRHFQINNNLGSARDRLRQFRRDLSNTFRKFSHKGQEDIVPAPATESESPSHYSHILQVLDPEPISQSSDSSSASSMKTMDGATERLFRQGPNSQSRPQTAAIFVHAGAGYHSTTNEHIHLGACDE